MTGTEYDGPIIDAHFHLWRYDPARYPWLAPAQPDNGLAPLRRDHTPADYAALARASGITSSIHIEANWNPDDPVAETEWLCGLKRDAAVANRLIAHAPMSEPHAEAILERQASFEPVVGIRDIMMWHPDPARSRISDRGLMENSVWLRNFAALSRLNLSFELLISPWQTDEAFRLAAKFPDTPIIIGHCGAPIDRDSEGMQRWCHGLRRLSDAPNMFIKISDPVAYDNDWSIDSLRMIVLECIEVFGPDRVMFGTDYPVANLHIGFAQWVDVFRNITQAFSESEKSMIFQGTALRVYWGIDR